MSPEAQLSPREDDQNDSYPFLNDTLPGNLQALGERLPILIITTLGHSFAGLAVRQGGPLLIRNRRVPVQSQRFLPGLDIALGGASRPTLSRQSAGRFPDHPRELLPGLQRVLSFVDMKIEAQTFENRTVGYRASIGQTLAVQLVNPLWWRDSWNSQNRRDFPSLPTIAIACQPEAADNGGRDTLRKSR
jgi:hypothetical protein